MSLNIEKIKQKFKFEGSFLRSVSILAGGTAFAQAIGVVVLPIITRLYTPEDFSVFAVYSSILSIISVAVCLRLEVAIPLPDRDEEALSLVILAVISNIVITIILCIAIFFFQDLIIGAINQTILEPYIWLLPIGIFFAGLYNALQYWTTRKRHFQVIAKTRMSQSVASSSIQIAGGYLGLGPLGLIIGQIVNFSAGIIRLFISFYKETKDLYKLISLSHLKRSWIKYDKFPKYSTFEALTNVAAIQLPVIIIAAVAIGPEAGYLMLAMKVMSIPMSLIGSAMAQVYLAQAPEYYNSGNLKAYTTNTIRNIAQITIIPLILLGIASPYLFPLVFGEMWEGTGQMVVWMIPWLIMQLLSSPVSMSLHITGNQKIALALQLFGFILRVGALLLISNYYPQWAFKYYAISGFFFYFLYMVVILKIISRRNEQDI